MPQTILVAEPHAPTLEVVKETLTRAGYRVLAATEPGEALEFFSSARPDAVLVALDLPRWQGSTLGKLLRATEGGARIPIIAMDKAHLGKVKGVGAVLELMVNAYIADPSRADELTGKLAQLLSSAGKAPKPTDGIGVTLSRTPVATGSMKARTLPALVHSFWRLARDGILVIGHHDLCRRIFFLKGAPLGYDSTARQDSLPHYLLHQGVLTSEQHDGVLEILRDVKATAGSALVGVGAVEPGEPLLAVLGDYSRAKIAEAYGMADGRYSFFAGAEFTSEIPQLEIPALGPLYDGARRFWPAKAFATALAPSMRRFPCRAASFAKELPALGLGTADLKLALVPDGRKTLRQLLSETRDLKETLALYWFLSLVDALEYSDVPAERAPGDIEVQVRAGPRKKSLPEEKARPLREDAIRILTASFFGALGLDVAADSEDIERAFHEAATRFHPDSYTEYELGPMEELLSSVQDKLAAAYRVLSDGEKRQGYVAYLLSRAEVPRGAPPHVEAEIAAKRGEHMMKGGDWKGARLAFERAVALHPREPEYYGYLAWATFESSEGDRVARARAAQRLVKKALAMNPTLGRLQVIAAILEDEAGNPGEARRQLVKLLKVEPDLSLAKRALQGLNRKHGAGEAK